MSSTSFSSFAHFFLPCSSLLVHTEGSNRIHFGGQTETAHSATASHSLSVSFSLTHTHKHTYLLLFTHSHSYLLVTAQLI